jgi:hypothetical protein
MQNVTKSSKPAKREKIIGLPLTLDEYARYSRLAKADGRWLADFLRRAIEAGLKKAAR